MTCSCNFVFGMQVVSKKEFQWNLVIRRVNGRSSKRRGRGFQKRKKWTGNQSTLGLDKLGCGKRTLLDYEQSLFFLSPSSEMRGTRKWPH